MLRIPLDFEVVEVRHGQPKMTWRRQVVKQVEEIKLTKEDATDRLEWHNGVNEFLKIVR